VEHPVTPAPAQPPTTFGERLITALYLLTEQSVPDEIQALARGGLADDDFLRLQEWARANAPRDWMTGIGIVEAAAALAREPVEGQGHDRSRPVPDLSRLTDAELRRRQDEIAAEARRREEEAQRKIIAARKARNAQIAAIAPKLLEVFDPAHTCRAVVERDGVADRFRCLRCAFNHCVRDIKYGVTPELSEDLCVELLGREDILEYPDPFAKADPVKGTDP
jgi:hypothetical protein